MRAAQCEQLCWWGAVALLLLAGVSWRRMERKTSDARLAAVTAIAAASSPVEVTSVDSAAEYVAAHDPFRFSHTPPTVTYSPGQESAPYVPPPPAPPRPSITLKGIVGGTSRWSAVLVGVPGREAGVLVRQGDTLSLAGPAPSMSAPAGAPTPVAHVLRVRRVGRDTVIVQGLDTTWTLTLRQ